MLFLKVPDRKGPDGKWHDTTVDEVRDALPKDIKTIVEFNDGINMVTVDFPESTYVEYKQVKKHLQDQGFAAY